MLQHDEKLQDQPLISYEEMATARAAHELDCDPLEVSEHNLTDPTPLEVLEICLMRIRALEQQIKEMHYDKTRQE